jgi:hypothetical protein
MERPPKILEVIRQEEAKDPAPEPFRIHRSPIWNPYDWVLSPSDDRVRDFVAWERDTLQPKYGIERGVRFTQTIGVAELFDYEFFFGGFPRLADTQLAEALRVKPGSPVIYYPRRAYDLWNSRYFILPYAPKWDDEHRGYAAFLHQTQRVFPAPDAFTGPGGLEKEREWALKQDVQVLRNLAVYPRAWVVHGARVIRAINGLSREDRNVPMQEILFQNDPVWKDPTRAVYDPREVAWVEQEDRDRLAHFIRGFSREPSEAATVTRLEADRVEVEANLRRPGLVVLAEVYYPGWTLTIDGKPAAVYRVNRAMRGVAVEAGRHHLVYTFLPRSFRVGLACSAAGLVLLGVCALVFAFRPVSSVLAPAEERVEETPVLEKPSLNSLAVPTPDGTEPAPLEPIEP